jgi:3-methyl-2-oxobutanoate hydroxymethyltransferase
VARAGIPVWAQFGVTPQTLLRYGMDYAAMMAPGAEVPAEMTDGLVADAKKLEESGASLLDFTNSGPAAGPAATRAVSIPVIGGAGGGPWLDGRVRMAHAAIGYAASAIDSKAGTYANVARVTLDAISEYAADVRAGRQIRGQRPAAGGS